MINTVLKPLIQEYYETMIPLNLRGINVELNLKRLRTHVCQFLRSTQRFGEQQMNQISLHLSQFVFHIPFSNEEIFYLKNESFFHCLLALISP